MAVPGADGWNMLSPVDPQTTLVVILGASQFPRAGLDGNSAFKASADALREYLLDPEGFRLPQGNLLDLFDTEKPASAVDADIAEFLIRHQTEMSRKPTDVLIYYVGHGGFTNDGVSDYFLVLRDTRKNAKRVSGYQIQSLATCLMTNATHCRRYLILDCCFSAAAFTSFQGPPLDTMIRQTYEAAPPKGTVLLCASSRKDAAHAVPGEAYTRFSQALLTVLRQTGDTQRNAPEFLSFQQIGELIREEINAKYTDDYARPEMHSPDQSRGDLAHLPFFPNPAKSGAGARVTTQNKAETELKDAIREYGENRSRSRRMDTDKKIRLSGAVPVSSLKEMLREAPGDQKTAMAVAVSLGKPHSSDNDIEAAEMLAKFLNSRDSLVRYRASESIIVRVGYDSTSPRAENIMKEAVFRRDSNPEETNSDVKASLARAKRIFQRR